MDEKLKNVIRLVAELRAAMQECPDVLSAYARKSGDEYAMTVQLYSGDGVEFTSEKKRENGRLEKYAFADGVQVVKVCL